MEIAYAGDEIFMDSYRTRLHFAHDLVNIQFTYDAGQGTEDGEVIFQRCVREASIGEKLEW